MKFYIILIMAGFVIADNIRQAERDLDALFAENLNTTDTCGGIEGTLDDSCYECYMCEDPRVTRFNIGIKKLKLKSADCLTVTVVCCIPQGNVATRNREDEACGRKVKDISGDRKTVRSVLHKEYPWRVWIYKKNTYENKLLCAGTVIALQPWLVMTSASCLHGLSPDQVAVSLTERYEDKVTDAHSIILHPSYKPNRKYVNDIALLVMDKSQSAPGWVERACLPSSPVMPATTCITTAEKNLYISTVVPKPNACEPFNIKSSLGQLCAIAPLDDYTPQVGAALLCEEQSEKEEIYNVAGIALTTTESVTTYTYVYQFSEWINNKKSEILRNDRN